MQTVMWLWFEDAGAVLREKVMGLVMMFMMDDAMTGGTGTSVFFFQDYFLSGKYISLGGCSSVRHCACFEHGAGFLD